MSEEVNINAWQGCWPHWNASFSRYTYIGKHVVFLFKCRRDWLPKTQAEFEKACAFHGIPNAHKLRWQAVETF